MSDTGSKVSIESITLKAVQLDLEAKGIIARGAGKPVRLFMSSRQDRP